MLSMKPEQKIDYFTPPDFNYVAGHVAEIPDELILVGGQAVAAWGIYYDVPAPKSEMPALTADTDWLGYQPAAEALCKAIERDHTHIELTLAAPFDSSANTAIAIIQREERRLLMDFLRQITGLENKAIERLALTINISGNNLRVMHPLHCLISRFANLKSHAIKRVGAGPAQAMWMISIIRRYLETLPERGAPPEEVAKSIRLVSKLAEHQPGKFCFVEMNLDALDSIPDVAVAYAGKGFANEEWPRVLKRIHGKRQDWMRRHEKKQSRV